MCRRFEDWTTLLLALSLPLAIAACGGDEPGTSAPGDEDDGDSEYALSVDDQSVEDGSTVVVDSATTAGDDVWVVIHADDDGEPGEIVGVSDLVEGTDEPVENIEVELDPAAEDGDSFWAMLHVDDPDDGEFTFGDDDSEDVPATVDDEVVQAPFSVEIDEEDDSGDHTPAVSVDDQTISPDNADTVSITEATVDQVGFVVVHADADGEPGEVLGASSSLEPGTSEGLEVTLDRDAEDGETLWAMLHHDDGSGEFEDAETDPPVTEGNDEPVVDSFAVTIDEDVEPEGPTVEVSDQVLPADAPDVVTVDSADFDENGFVVVHADNDGAPGEILGASDLLEQGDAPHSDIEVMLDSSTEDGDQLHAMLHADDNDNGSFEESEDSAIPPPDGEGEPVTSVTDTFAVTHPSVDASDLTLNEADGDLSTIVTVDRAVSHGPGWLVVHPNACSNLGNEPIGWSAVDHGENSEVAVELHEPAAEQEANRDLCAMLYAEDDDNGQFEYDGTDESADAPIEDEQGNNVNDAFNASVTEGTAAIRVTLGVDGSATAYTVESVEPSLYEDDVDEDPDSSDGDPRFTFRPDWRYEFVNTVAGNHPFEFLNPDQVLLSQAADGENAPLESDESIDWNEVDSETFRFTVSEAFETNSATLPTSDDDNVASYRCNTHTDAMTGPVEYQ